MTKSSKKSYTLGLDLGPASVGWAIVNTKNGNPTDIVDAGVRVFQAGLDSLETDARGKSRNLERREKRQIRRGYERRSRRMQKLARALQQAGLFPEGPLETGVDRHNMLNSLDANLDDPYQLRARALDKRLEPFELGRALYHLAQRRGFLSNRKTPEREDEDLGTVKSDIKKLGEAIVESDARTQGEYFAQLNDGSKRIRGCYLGRQMCHEEFEKIWSAQSRFHESTLTKELRKRLEHCIFHQRPLKSQKHLIGMCELEPQRRRSPWNTLTAQRFRYLQTMNNLRIVGDPDRIDGELTADERIILSDHLERTAKSSFPALRRLLKLPRNSKFNLEIGGEKNMLGNAITSKLIKIFGDDNWQKLGANGQNGVVEDLRSIEKEATAIKRAIHTWGLSEAQANQFASITLPEGYCNFSRQAIERLLPLLERGVALQTAVRELYPERWERSSEPEDLLPALIDERLPDIRNPIVTRTLNEMRRVVNAIISKYGRPESIHVELGRELKQPPKARVEASKRMRRNEKARDDARKRILEECQIDDPSNDDILKIRLAEECGWHCPYTGKQIGIRDLIGDNPRFDIEHIIPRHRSLDNSFANKTLCLAEENRNVKGNRTPFEAYGETDRWQEILDRVENFVGPMRYAKLRRFKMTETDVEASLQEFTSRQLNDMRYTSKYAKQYLGLLYGGVKEDGIDHNRKRRIQVGAGQATAVLRSALGLNAILGDGPTKSRDDHRHHAVDAVVVALMSAGMIKSLSDATKRSQTNHVTLAVDPPWPGFLESVYGRIHTAITSHSTKHRVRGPLHKDTLFGTPHCDENGKEIVTVRKPLASLSKREIEHIVDPAVRAAVHEHLSKHGDDLKKAFADDSNHPCLRSGNGASIPIHRVRIERTLKTVAVGDQSRRRFVESDTNHHMAIFEISNENGARSWDADVVSLLEATGRLREGRPVIDRTGTNNRRFLFSLACGDIIELDTEDDTRNLFVVRTIPKSKQIRFVPIFDARLLKEIPKSGFTAYPNTLRQKHCLKKVVTPLGEIRDARD